MFKPGGLFFCSGVSLVFISIVISISLEAMLMVGPLIHWRITIRIFFGWPASANLSSSKQNARFCLQNSVSPNGFEVCITLVSCTFWTDKKCVHCRVSVIAEHEFIFNLFPFYKKEKEHKVKTVCTSTFRMYLLLCFLEEE